MVPRMPSVVYADTSVFGGCFDVEFRRWSEAFVAQVLAGRFRLTTSALVEAELEDAPARVRAVFDGLRATMTLATLGEPALSLRQEYLAAGIVGPRSRNDALHVAVASVAGCDAIVSWNFKHIVHAGKIPSYNAVNVARGLGPIQIHSPAEVLDYEDT